MTRFHGLVRQRAVAAWCAVAFGMALSIVCFAAETPSVRPIPYKPDPPPAIDGRIEDWQTVPNGLDLRDRAHATYAPQRWKSAQDLSARACLAWREEYLYFAVEVHDDAHQQRGQGERMFRGDHVELYLDLAPDRDPQRTDWGDGQVQLGFSPGTLDESRDATHRLAPETVVFWPAGAAAQGVLLAAQKTEQGYVVEAAVPWKLLQSLARVPAQRPTAGLALGFELAVSDTDSAEPAQEKMMTVLTSPWKRRNRARLAPAVLAPADGKAPEMVRTIELAQAAKIDRGKSTEIRFDAPTLPAGKDAVLALKARLDTPKVAGYTSALRLALNGTQLDAARLVNWEAEETRVDGAAMKPMGGIAFNTPYSPDFDSPNKHSTYALRGGPKLCRYELRVSDLLKPKDNVLRVENAARPGIERTLVVGDIRLETRTPKMARTKRPAPTGPLSKFLPEKSLRLDYTTQPQGESGFTIRLGNRTFRVASEFSTPQPAWVTGANRYFDWKREIRQLDEAIVVRDTFTNLTQENLPLMQRHRLLAPETEKWRKVWLAGLSPSGLTGSATEAAQPTTYGVLDQVGVGLLALDDVTQVHVSTSAEPDRLGLADNHCVLRPGATHVAQWAVLPTASADYFAFVNAVRRLRNVNFTLPGSFAFLRAHPRLTAGKWTDEEFTNFARFKNAQFLCGGLSFPQYKGRYGQGTAFQTLDWSVAKAQGARLRKLLPECKQLFYYHCFIDATDEAAEKYHDARLLGPDGAQADYGQSFYKIFVPTAENSFGRDVAKNVDIILGAQPEGLGCDGVYWDEFEYSRYAYGYGDFTKPGGLPWDGVSADINPKTMKISRLKTSVTLISQPWRLALAKRILKDHPLIANGQPHTRTMAELHFPRFVETGGITNCIKAQLYSPIALGDHLTERSEVDAYRVMLRALDFGCLYYWYNDVNVIPTHPHLTQYMFPITPVELHEGYVIGKERIITNRSGLFGWGDSSRHEVHVFDDQGRERSDFAAPTITRDAQTFTELRLPEDFSAAIVRKP